MGKRRSGYVQIDVSQVIDEIDDDDLLEEVTRRKLVAGVKADDLDEVRAAYLELNRGRSAEAFAILDRLLNPKWKSVEQCAKAFAEASGRARAS